MSSSEKQVNHDKCKAHHKSFKFTDVDCVKFNNNVDCPSQCRVSEGTKFPQEFRLKPLYGIQSNTSPLNTLLQLINPEPKSIAFR